VISLVLVPLAGLLVMLELFGGGIGARHYLDANGISSKRREWSVIYYIVVGLIGPVVVSIIWLDPFRSGVSKRSRLHLIGLVGSAVGLLAALLLLPY
jgi:hypothetical protein